MQPFADIVAYSPEGQIVLAVEVKSGTGSSRAWATQMRRNLLAHGTTPSIPYFILALPDRFYLWKNVDNSPELIEPSYEIDALPFLQPYYESAGLSPENIFEHSFNIIMIFWLNELIIWGIPESIPKELKRTLLDSGLLDALKSAKVASQVPA